MSKANILQGLGDVNQATSKELKLMVETLIAKTKRLVETLEEALKELEITKEDREYWKRAYLNFRQSCQNFIECKGLTPFQSTINLHQAVDQQSGRECQNYSKGEKAYFKTQYQKQQKPQQKQLLFTNPKRKYDLIDDINDPYNSTTVQNTKRGVRLGHGASSGKLQSRAKANSLSESNLSNNYFKIQKPEQNKKPTLQSVVKFERINRSPAKIPAFITNATRLNRSVAKNQQR